MNVPVSFVYPWLLLLILAVAPVILFMSRRQNAIGHSAVRFTHGIRSWSWIGRFSKALLVVAWTTCCLAAAQPQLSDQTLTDTRPSRDIVVIMDNSSSMVAAVKGANPNADGKPYRRIDAAKDAVCTFVAGRQGDRVALMTFNSDSFYNWPLTTEIDVILKKCARLNQDPTGGTNFEGPTERDSKIGAIQAPLNHLKEEGQALTKVIVIVTDGEASIGATRFQQLAAQVDEQGVTLYVVGVGHEWTSGTANKNTEPLRRFVERVDGHVFAADDKATFDKVMQAIDHMETSPVATEITTTFYDVYQYFLIAAVLTWMAYLGVIVISRETM